MTMALPQPLPLRIAIVLIPVRNLVGHAATEQWQVCLREDNKSLTNIYVGRYEDARDKYLDAIGRLYKSQLWFTKASIDLPMQSYCTFEWQGDFKKIYNYECT